MWKKLVLSVVTLTIAGGPIQARELSPREIIRRIDATERVVSSESVAKQIITTSSGKKRTLGMEVYTKDKNAKQLVIYTSPRRVAGDKILMLNDGDDIWFYTPKTDRIRHLASHAKRQKMQGSDFAYEDMAGGEIEKDYTYTLLGQEPVDGRDCYKFELIPTESGPHYAKLVLWADKEKFISLRIEYYEDDGLLKRLDCQDVQKIDNHWYAMQLVMTNVKEGGRTVMVTETVQFDVELADGMFSTRRLKRR